MVEGLSMQMAAFAHDLRTPMSCAAGAAQQALEAKGEDVSRQLHQILEAIRVMDGMLEGMVGETAMESFDGLCGALRSLCMPQAARKGQSLELDMSALAGRQFDADYGALMRVMSNLLSNAMKYTQDGGSITLRAQLLESARHTDCCKVRLIVADNGMGMKHSFMLRMYQPFARARESEQAPGKGLGLSIVRELVRRMGGSVHVKSEWGKGSVFIVTVPVRERRITH